jgi:hypothetical protein
MRIDVCGVDLRVRGVEEGAVEPSPQGCDESVVTRLTIVLRIVDLAENGIETCRNEAVVRDQVAGLYIDILTVTDAKDLTAT